MADSGNQGFASMDEDKQREIASKGGQASGGQFKSGDKRTSDAGKKGAANQSRAAKAEGGRNSHRGGNS